jgi:hypothetical protein
MSATVPKGKNIVAGVSATMPKGKNIVAGVSATMPKGKNIVAGKAANTSPPTPLRRRGEQSVELIKHFNNSSPLSPSPLERVGVR